MSTTTLLEATMLICFGAAWPVANLRMLRSRRAEGPGLLPAILILCGYSAGMLAKVLCVCSGSGLPPIFWLYLLNASSVAMNIHLQYRFSPDSASPSLRSRAKALIEGIHQLPRSARAAAMR